jgi:hypothetical protein
VKCAVERERSEPSRSFERRTLLKELNVTLAKQVRLLVTPRVLLLVPYIFAHTFMASLFSRERFRRGWSRTTTSASWSSATAARVSSVHCARPAPGRVRGLPDAHGDAGARVIRGHRPSLLVLSQLCRAGPARCGDSRHAEHHQQLARHLEQRGGLWLYGSASSAHAPLPLVSPDGTGRA